MDILLDCCYAFLIGLIGLFLMRSISPYSHGYITLKGRLNRLQCALSLLFLSATMHVFNLFIDQLMAVVVILPAYYGIKLVTYAGYVLLLPFYYTVYVRRFNDFSAPGFPLGIILGMYIIFTNFYLPLKNIYLLHTIAVCLLHLALILIPGTKRKNAYGNPVIWPPTLGKKKKG